MQALNPSESFQGRSTFSAIRLVTKLNCVTVFHPI